ncbi:MAG: sodium:solute symporter [Rubricella sp.]
MEQIQNAIATLDLAVIAVYFLIVIAIGVWVSRKTETGEDLFLAGRSLGWFAIGLSLFASNISTSTMIGLTGSAYGDGIAVSAYEWLAGIPLLILAFVFAPLFLKARVNTVPEWLDNRFDRRVRYYFSGLTIFFTILVDTAGGLYAGGIVLQTFFPGLDLWMTCLAIGVFAGLYTAAGGLRAVVYTDMLQAGILIFGTSAVAYFMFRELGFDWAMVREALPEGHLSMVQPLDDPQLPWPGLFFGVVLLGFWYWVTNQYIVQRVLGAKSLADAQWGAVLGGILKVLPLFIMVLPGAMAVPLLPDIPENDMVFPTMITQMLPAGLTGLVLAGLVAAIMSSVDSTLNSSSTLVIHDFVTKPEKELEPQKARRYGRIATIAFMIFAVIWAPMIQYFGGLWSYLQQMFSVLVPPLVAIFIGGAFWRRGTANAALMTLIAGHAVGAGIFVAGQLGWWPIHFTINVALMTVFSFIVFIVVSLSEEAENVPDEAIWNREEALAPEVTGHGWYRDIRFHAGLLFAAMLGVLIAFW